MRVFFAQATVIGGWDAGLTYNAVTTLCHSLDMACESVLSVACLTVCRTHDSSAARRKREGLVVVECSVPSKSWTNSVIVE